MKKSGFTLIELLIVVAIIGILAAIAIPNFLQAQTRAKATRVKADQRTLSIGIESYVVDNGRYPIDGGANQAWNLSVLTSPIEYISSIDVFFDPFNEQYYPYTYAYINYDKYSPWGSLAYSLNWKCSYRNWGYHSGWGLMSWGPSQTYAVGEYFPPCYEQDAHRTEALNMVYDPSNGTISVGYIMRFGGEIGAVPQVVK